MEKHSDKNAYLTGGCQCGEVRYRLLNPPLFVHACHCIDCQKKRGSAFGITTIVLECDIERVQGTFTSKQIAAHRTAFVCASCQDVIYRTATNHPATALLRSGTCDDPRVLEIHAHIWTLDKHPWLELPDSVPQFDKGYDRNETWPQESLARLRAELEKEI